MHFKCQFHHVVRLTSCHHLLCSLLCRVKYNLIPNVKENVSKTDNRYSVRTSDYLSLWHFYS